MNTSALIVELAVVGFQVLIWLMLLLMQLDLLVPLITEIQPFATLLVLFVLAAAYSLGLICDAFTALFEGQLTEKWDKTMLQREVMVKLLFHNADAHQQIYDRQLQARLLRSTALNSLLIAIISLPLIYKMGCNGMIVGGLLVLLVSLAISAWRRRVARYLEPAHKVASVVNPDIGLGC